MRGRQHCDNTTQSIEHVAPHTSCREVFKGVLDDRGARRFPGPHRGPPGRAARPTATCSPRLLLLSDRRRDRRQAGAGDLRRRREVQPRRHRRRNLDHDALFYLRSARHPEAQARAMLIEAFLAEAIEAISAEDASARRSWPRSATGWPTPREGTFRATDEQQRNVVQRHHDDWPLAGLRQLDRRPSTWSGIREDFPILAPRRYMAPLWSTWTTPPRRRSRAR